MAELEEGLMESQELLLTRSHTDTLLLTSSPGATVWNVPVIWIWWKGKRGSFLPHKGAGRNHCFFVEQPTFIQPAGTGRYKVWLSICLGNILCPVLVIPCDPALPNLWAHSSCFQHLFHWLSSNFSKVHKPSTSSIWPWNAPYLLLKSSISCTRDSWPYFSA